RAAALDLDVHQVRHGVAHGRRRRRQPLHSHAARLCVCAQLHLSTSGHGRGTRRDHVRDAHRGHRGVLPRFRARGGDVVTRGGAGRAGVLYIGGLTLLVVGAFPLFWMLATSLKPSAEIFATPPRLVPAHPTLENFARLFVETAFLPFCLWLLRAFFESIPLELEEAAMVDGAGRARAVWHVVLPLALPGLIAAAIFTFILAYNDFLFALVLITSEELKTLPVGVNDLFNATIVDWGMIMAAGVMITLPAILFFAGVQRYLVQGWGAGGVKG